MGACLPACLRASSHWSCAAAAARSLGPIHCELSRASWVVAGCMRAGCVGDGERIALVGWLAGRCCCCCCYALSSSSSCRRHRFTRNSCTNCSHWASWCSSSSACAQSVAACMRPLHTDWLTAQLFVQGLLMPLMSYVTPVSGSAAVGHTANCSITVVLLTTVGALLFWLNS